ncbi:hypothetical protein GH714_037535 [Hevea brasiliensis]|uniref:Leucine-rich repeat-containing N-terminal plant-type domain-containing protein n=1 Tax=Hevea brasiliensis TaxID=3981 RepID=A0A6A6LUP5_HEVBR|nr:hypothetical protein GH714_037535 [Hevea brasiliensis]
MANLSPGNGQNNQNWGWNLTSDPCNDEWVGVSCDSQSQTVKGIVLGEYNFTGTLDASSLCMVKSLAVLSLISNNIVGIIPEEIGNCTSLTHLYIRKNKFVGVIPDALSQLSNLERLDISNNHFSGVISTMSRISGLVSFLAQDNHLSGEIPEFDFVNLQQFNVSNNNFIGQIPDVQDRAEMHKNVGEQRDNWNKLLLNSINMITLTATTMAGVAATGGAGAPLLALRLSSTLLFTAATGMLFIMNKIQPSQLAEEQRNATKLFRQLQSQIQTTLALYDPTELDVKDAMDKYWLLTKLTHFLCWGK